MPHLRVSEEVTALIEARTEMGAAKDGLGSFRIVGVMARHSSDAPMGEIKATTKNGEIVPIEAKSHCLRHKGRDCYAYVRITSQRERAVGGPDAVITVDEWDWDQGSKRWREAVIAHELEHLEVNENGVLKLKPHDFEVGWFANIAAEFGEDSVERIQARKLLADEIGQLFFPGMEPSPKAEETTPKTRVPLRRRKDLRALAEEIEAHPEAEQIKKAVAGIAAANSLGVPLKAAIQTDLETEIKTRKRARFTDIPVEDRAKLAKDFGAATKSEPKGFA